MRANSILIIYSGAYQGFDLFVFRFYAILLKYFMEKKVEKYFLLFQIFTKKGRYVNDLAQ